MGDSRLKIIVFGVATLVCVGVIIFLSFRIRAVSTEVVQLREQASVKSGELERLAVLERDARLVLGTLGHLDALLVGGDDFILLPVKLEKMGKSFNLETHWSFENAIIPAQNGLPPTKNFTVVATGTLENFLRYMELLEQLRYFFVFRQTNITSDANIVAGEMSARLTGTLFVHE